MGGEIGQWSEWNCKEEIALGSSQYDRHQQLQQPIRELNHFYQAHCALWEKDFDSSGFEWIDFHDEQNSVISYLRKGSNRLLSASTISLPIIFPIISSGSPISDTIKEVFNTDREEFGGSGKINPRD